MIKHIPRKLVERFIARRKLHDLAGFLHFVLQSRHAAEFSRYAGQHGCAIASPKSSRRHFLFHGSQRYCSRFVIPSSRDRFVYATDNPNYAIFLAILNIKNASAGIVVKRGKASPFVDLAFVNGPSSFRNGWVHVVQGEHFKKIRNSEYISTKPSKVIFAIPVSPLDTTAAITIRARVER